MDREYAVGAGKQKWHYPGRTECLLCHSRAANFVLGLSTVQLNKVHDYGGVHDEQLRVLEHLGILRVPWLKDIKKSLGTEFQATRLQREAQPSPLLTKAPAKYPKLVDPADRSQPLEARARSYLQTNCAICHVEAGGGNAQFRVDLIASDDQMKLIDVKPQHDTFGLRDARLIAPERRSARCCCTGYRCARRATCRRWRRTSSTARQ